MDKAHETRLNSQVTTFGIFGVAANRYVGTSYTSVGCVCVCEDNESGDGLLDGLSVGGVYTCSVTCTCTRVRMYVATFYWCLG